MICQETWWISATDCVHLIIGDASFSSKFLHLLQKIESTNFDSMTGQPSPPTPKKKKTQQNQGFIAGLMGKPQRFSGSPKRVYTHLRRSRHVPLSFPDNQSVQLRWMPSRQVESHDSSGIRNLQPNFPPKKTAMFTTICGDFCWLIFWGSHHK